jgi:hypothetical protein
MSLHYFAGDNYDVAVLPQAGMMIQLEGDRPAQRKTSLITSSAPATGPTAVQPDWARFSSASGDIMPWGDGNDFPQRIHELYYQDPIIPTTLGKTASMLVSGGIMAVLADVNEKGERVFLPLPKDNPVTAEIEAFIGSAHFKRYLREMASDAVWYFNGFPEMLLNKARTKIVQLHPLNAEECRWARMDEQGNLPYVYVSASWPHATISDDRTKRIHALDPYRWDRVEWLRESNFYNCVYPISYPTPGKRFYSLAHHYSIVESGWLDVHRSIPAFKKFMLRNQMAIKYHVKVDKAYWPMRFGAAWNKADDKGKEELIRGWVDYITKTLTNVENAGSMLMTQIEAGLDGKPAKEYVIIEAVPDPFKDGKYLDDNLEAAANIFYALGIDPTLVGFAGGEKMGARSGGSDKREAHLIALHQMAPHRDMIIEPLEFIAEFNGWKKEFPLLDFPFCDKILTTLDSGAGSKDFTNG